MVNFVLKMNIFVIFLYDKARKIVSKSPRKISFASPVEFLHDRPRKVLDFPIDFYCFGALVGSRDASATAGRIAP